MKTKHTPTQEEARVPRRKRPGPPDMLDIQTENRNLKDDLESVNRECMRLRQQISGTSEKASLPADMNANARERFRALDESAGKLAPTPIPPLAQADNRIREAITSLENAFEQMSDKLRPIRAINPPAPEGNCATGEGKPIVCSPLYELMTVHAFAIERLTRRVNQVADELEV